MLFPFRIRRSSIVSPQQRAVAWHSFVWRWDSAMLLLLILGFLLWAFVVRRMDLWGAFDGSGQFEPVGDSRKRFDVEEEIRRHGVLDATHRGDRLVVTLKGGGVREYDTGMDIWGNLPPLPETLVDRDIVQIRAGNGNGNEPFDERRDRLFARTASGGLAVLRDDGWQVISRDTKFFGLSGRPVEWRDVTAAAVSDDRRHVVLGCRTEGLGLYDARDRVWPRIEGLSRLRDIGAIREIAWWKSRGCFVIGGERRLALFRVPGNPAAAMEPPTAVDSAGVTSGDTDDSIELPSEFAREIVDLHVTPQGTLWVLDRQPRSPNQVRISNWAADREPVVEFEENEIHLGLTLSDLNFAMQIDDRLFVCGETTNDATCGVFEYHCDRHAWSRRSTTPVNTTLRSLDGGSFYVGTEKTVEQFPTDANSSIWRFEGSDRSVQRLIWGRAGEILAQLKDDRIFSLRRGQPPVEVFHAPASNVDLATVHSAYDLDGTHILLVGPHSAVIHNTQTRVYDDFPISSDDQEAKWLAEPGLSFASTGGSAFFHSQDGTVRVLPLRDLIGGGKRFQRVKPHQVAAGTALSLMPMSTGKVAVLDADRVLHRIDASSGGPVVLGGRRIPESSGQTLVPRDVAGLTTETLADRDSAFLFPEQKRLTVHRSDSRELQNYALPEDEEILELASMKSRLLMPTRDGDVYDFRSTKDRWPPQGATSVLLGGDGRFNSNVNLDITDDELSDVRVDTDGDLYLAGAGKVVRYSPAHRRVVDRWNYASTSSVRLAGISNHKPVAVINGHVMHGSDSKLEEASRAETVSLFHEQLWITATGADGLRRLGWYPRLNKDPRRQFVFFKHPKSDARQFLDAVRLSSGGEADGDVLVSTDAGLRVYSSRARSWYWFKDKSFFAAAELYRLGDFVLVAKRLGERRYELGVFHVHGLKVPHEPDASALTFRSPLWQPPSELRAFAMDETKGDFVFVLPDNSVHRWRPGVGIASGSSVVEIAAPGDSPEASDLKRVVSCGSYLCFAGEKVLWTYKTNSHTWRRLSLKFPAGTTASDFSVQGIENDPRLDQVWCAVRSGGELLVGAWTTTAASSDINLKSLFKPSASSFMGNADRLIDAQQMIDPEKNSDVITLLQSDRVDWFHPDRREHRSGASFPGASPTEKLIYGKIDGRRIATNSLGRFWIAKSSDEFPSGFRYCDVDPSGDTKYAFDQSAAVWRRQPNGGIDVCQTAAAVSDEYQSFAAQIVPMEVDPASVLAVYPWHDLSVLLTVEGARVYDEKQFREVSVSDVKLSPVKSPLSRSGLRAFEDDGSLWIQRDGALLHLAGSSDPSKSLAPPPRLFRDAVEFVPFSSGQHWVRATNQWHFWRPAERMFAPVPRSATPVAESGLKLFLRSDLSPVAIDRASRQLLWWNPAGSWNARSTAILPSNVVLDEIRWLARDGRDWWALFDDRIERLAERRREASFGLHVVDSYRLSAAVRNGLREGLLNVRLSDDGIEFVGVRCGCRAAAVSESVTERGDFRCSGGLQWWTSRIDESPLATSLDANARLLFIDELHQTGWLATDDSTRFFALMADKSRLPGSGNHSSVAKAAAGVLWSNPNPLDADTRRLLAGREQRLSLTGLELPLIGARPLAHVFAEPNLKNSATGTADAVSFSLPDRHSESLHKIPRGTPLRLVERFERFLPADQSTEVWYRAVRDDFTMLWTPAAQLDLEKSRVTADSAPLYSDPRGDSPVVGRSPRGTAMSVVGVQKGWALLFLTKAEVGWLPETAVRLKVPVASGKWSEVDVQTSARAAAFRQSIAKAQVEFGPNGALTVTLSETGSTSRRMAVVDPWPSISSLRRDGNTGWESRFGKVPNGRPAWQAVTDLEIKQGSLVALRPGGDVKLAPAGGFLEVKGIKVDRSLNLGWLKWDRQSKHFEMNCTDGPQVFPPSAIVAAVPGGGTRFLFEEVDGLVYRESGKPFVSNRHGVWRYDSDNLSLTRGTVDSVEFRPHVGAVAARPFVGGFLDDKGAYIQAVKGMPVASGHTGHNVVKHGPVTFHEDVRQTPLKVTLTRMDRTVLTDKVLTDDGFNWDRRHSLAINAAGVLLQSDAGVHQHAAVPESEFSASPEEQGRLFSEDRATTWLHHGDDWWKQTRSGWTAVDSPRLNRTLVAAAAAGGWSWKRNGAGDVTVTCAGPAVGFRQVADASGIVYFTSDELGDAAAFDGELHVVTQSAHQFMDLAATATEPLAVGGSLDQGTARQPLPAKTKLEEIDLAVRRDRNFGAANRGEILYRIINGRIEHWNKPTARFEPTLPADNPLMLERLASTSRLRFWRHDDARLKKEVRLDKPVGGDDWVEYTFSVVTGPRSQQQIRFPFDRAKSVAARFGQLFVGTDCGLQVSPESDAIDETKAGKFDLHQPTLRLLQVRDGGGSLVVDRVGIPFANPTVLAVRSDSLCLATSDGKTFVAQPSGRELDERLRFQSALWQWREQTVSADTEARPSTNATAPKAAASKVVLAGRYINERRVYDSELIDFTNGRLPHDRIIDATHHDGQTFTLWHDGWLTTHSGDNADFNAGFQNFDQRSFKPTGLFIVRHANLQLQPSLYVRNDQRDVLRYDGPTGQWLPVRMDEERRRLNDYAASRPAFSRDRLRLVVNDQRQFQFQYLTLPTSASPNGQWRELPWRPRDNSDVGTAAVRFCLECDHWQEFICDQRSDSLWAATPMGFCRFSRVAGDSRPASGSPHSATAPGRVKLRLDEFVSARQHADAERLSVTEIRIATAPAGATQQVPEQFAVEFRRDYDSAHVYSATLDTRRDTGVFQKFDRSDKSVSKTDPFAEQEPVKTSFWKWRLTGRNGHHASNKRHPQPGKLECRLLSEAPDAPGENIDLSSGRFPFDQPDSLVCDGKAVHLAAPFGEPRFGWIAVNGEDLHLRHWKRPFDRETAKRVERVFPARNSEHNEVLGLLTANGEVLTILGNKEKKESDLAIFAGDDGFWSYRQKPLTSSREISSRTTPASASTRLPGELLANVRTGAQGIGRRHLLAGQFTDDVICGLPVQRFAFDAGTQGVTDDESDSCQYFIPTLAGIEGRTADFSRQKLEHPKLPDQADDATDSAERAPRVVYLDEKHRLHWLSLNSSDPGEIQMSRLDSFDQRSTQIVTQEREVLVPTDAVPISARRDMLGNFLIRWKRHDETGWTLIEKTGNGANATSENTMRIPVQTWRRFQQNRYVWGNPEPVLTLRIDPAIHHLIVLDSKHNENSHRIRAPQEPIIELISYGSQLLTVTTTGVYKLQLNRPLVTAFSGAGTPAATNPD